MRIRTPAYAVHGIGAILLLSACGGGGGDDGNLSLNPPPSSSPQPQNPVTGVGSGLSLASNTLTFSTNNRNATPAPQAIATTLDYTGLGTPYFKVEISGDQVLVRIFTQVTNGTGETLIVPSETPNLQPGAYSNVVKISVCIDDPDCANNRLLGSPQTVNVSYTITSSVQGDTVSPSVVPAANGPLALGGTLTGTVILRGRGLSSATSVQFGNVAATEVSVISDTEVRARYEFLQAGVYPISVNDGAIPFSGKLTAIQTPGFPRTTLLYPAKPQEIVGMVYDAARASVFVAARYPQSAGNQLIKFSYNGTSWNAPASLTIADIRDVVLSPDGGRLLVATDTSIIELDPETLTAFGTYIPTDIDITSGSVRLHQLASANDGYVMAATTGGPDPGSFIYLYSAADHTFTKTDFATFPPFNIASNVTGSRIAVAEVATSDHIFFGRTQLYNASKQLIEYKNPSEPSRDESKGIRSARPAIDKTGERIAFNGAKTPVYNSAFSRIGVLPSTTRAVAFNFDGTIAYTFDVQDDGTSLIRAFDSSPVAVLGEYRELSGRIPVTLDPGTSAVFMATTPNATQAFIAGISGVVVENLL
jgi:hypothetical protein